MHILYNYQGCVSVYSDDKFLVDSSLWHKKLVKCLETDMQIKISRRLGWIVDNICCHLGNMSLFGEFMEDFVDESKFIDYFKAIWHPRIG